MTCNFRVGQKVVCIDASERKGPGKYTVLPVQGRVYTVRGISAWQWNCGFSGVGLYLEEIHRPPTPQGEAPWGCWRFRPVVERKTDISIFKALLTPSKEKVETAP